MDIRELLDSLLEPVLIITMISFLVRLSIRIFEGFSFPSIKFPRKKEKSKEKVDFADNEIDNGFFEPLTVDSSYFDNIQLLSDIKLSDINEEVAKERPHFYIYEGKAGNGMSVHYEMINERMSKKGGEKKCE